ncbi:MAG: response regulator [Gammaproteobacteria bacterium]|nr:response regulator [Gammaproteobacteria bacterium]MDH5735603.1 response regulator [Gammaproteobacteria bacterium]
MGSHHKILHIEDDPDQRNYIKTLLEDRADIIRTDSIKQAKQLIAENDFKLIILDLTLPDGSGMDIINLLNISKIKLPVIIFSAHDVIDNMPNVKRVFLKNRHKPEDLIKLVDSILN